MRAELDALVAAQTLCAERLLEALATAPASHTHGPFLAATAAAQPAAQRTASRQSVIGSSKASRELLSSVTRDEQLIVKPTTTGSPYTQLADVSTLIECFVRRGLERGFHLVEKHGRELGLQRHANQNSQALKVYADKVLVGSAA